MNISKLLLSSETNEWYTPSGFLNLVYQVMQVDLDPCSNIDKQVIANTHYVGVNGYNGLALPWSGNVFMNPPYGKTGNKSNTGIWCDKLIKEDPEQSITLIKASTDTKHFHKMAEYADCFLLRKGRIGFIPAPGNESSGSTIANVVFYKGPNPELFKQVFGLYGLIVD